MEHIYTYTNDGKRVKAFERAMDGKWVDASR